MNRDEYLGCDAVKDFTWWLSNELKADTLQHSSNNGKTKIIVKFSGLSDALSQYSWDFNFLDPGTGKQVAGSTYHESGKALDLLRAGLQRSLDQDDDNEVKKWCCAVINWGGVRNGNAKWFEEQARKKSLGNEIRRTRDLLNSDDDRLVAIKRFNAGMTKIYSLIVRNFIIYDSRVAAAIAWFVLHWCRQTGLKEVPSSLLFPCMPAKESRNPAIRKLRNPSQGGHRFPWVNNNSIRHAKRNLRASWILASGLESAVDTPFHRRNDGLRALEAALFMWGYDLNENRRTAALVP